MASKRLPPAREMPAVEEQLTRRDIDREIMGSWQGQLNSLTADLRELSYTVRGHNGDEGMLVRIARMEERQKAQGDLLQAIYDRFIPKPQEETKPSKPENSGETRLNMKQLGAVFLVALTTLLAAVVEYLSKPKP